MNSGSSKVSWLPRAVTILAVISCYGTTATIGLLSLLGITLAIDESVWAGTIAVLAALAALAIAASYRRHRVLGPMLFAALGLAIILWVMYGPYNPVIELVGFILLIAAAVWDWRAGAGRGALAHDVSWIVPSALADHLKHDPPPVIIDVRGPDEFIGPLGHIANASNIPVGELPQRSLEISALKDQRIILVCRTDKRSARAEALLRRSGFRDVHVLQGGMERWNEKGLPVVHRTASGQA